MKLNTLKYLTRPKHKIIKFPLFKQELIKINPKWCSIKIGEFYYTAFILGEIENKIKLKITFCVKSTFNSALSRLTNNRTLKYLITDKGYYNIKVIKMEENDKYSILFGLVKI